MYKQTNKLLIWMGTKLSIVYWISCDYINNESPHYQVGHTAFVRCLQRYTHRDTCKLVLSLSPFCPSIFHSFYLCISSQSCHYAEFRYRVYTLSNACVCMNCTRNEAQTHTLHTIRVSVNHLDALIATVCLSHWQRKIKYMALDYYYH